MAGETVSASIAFKVYRNADLGGGMTVELEPKPMNTITLPESLSIYEVKALHDTLQNTDISDNITLDLAATNEIDSAGMQLLLAVVQLYKTESCSVVLANVANSVQDTIRLLGGEFTYATATDGLEASP